MKKRDEDRPICPLCDKEIKGTILDWEGETVCVKCYDAMFPPQPGTKDRKGKWVLGRIRTRKQFEKHCRDVAKDTIADGFDLDGCAPDLADCMFYDSNVKAYVLRNNPWIKTKTQWREFVADYIVA